MVRGLWFGKKFNIQNSKIGETLLVQSFRRSRYERVLKESLAKKERVSIRLNAARRFPADPADWKKQIFADPFFTFFLFTFFTYSTYPVVFSRETFLNFATFQIFSTYNIQHITYNREPVCGRPAYNSFRCHSEEAATRGFWKNLWRKRHVFPSIGVHRNQEIVTTITIDPEINSGWRKGGKVKFPSTKFPAPNSKH